MQVSIDLSVVGALVLTAGAASFLPAQQSAASLRQNEPLKAYLRSYFSPGKVPPEKTTRITAVSVKTDGGKNEYVIYVSGQGWCGSGGCTMLVVEPIGSSFKLLGRVTIVQLPIRLLPTMKNGHPDLGVRVQGGGVQQGHEAVLSFDGTTYPRNPSASPARRASATRGKVVIATTQGSVPLYD